MAKVRVHELAKKYDVPSKDVLKMLNDLGEFVKAPSSTVEPPVEKKFEDKYGADRLPRQGQGRQEGGQEGAREEGSRLRRARGTCCRSGRGARGRAARGQGRARPTAVHARPAPAGPGRPRAGAPAGGPAQAAQPAAEVTQEAPAAAPVEHDADGGEEAPAASAGAGFKPGPRPPRPGAPRPGNNPFSSSQGMGTPPAPTPGAAPAAPGAPAGTGSSDQRPPRPPAGRDGMPRPNPAMCPSPRPPSVVAPVALAKARQG